MVYGVFYGNAGTGSFSVGETLRENVARVAKKVYFGDKNGIARKAKKAYIGDKNGIARRWFGSIVADVPVGSSVYMNVDGVRTEFVVAHRGLPSSDYDSSCDGTWLLMKDCYVRKAWSSVNNTSYANSEIHSYLNDTFVNLFDSTIRNLIKQVKIPYTEGNSVNGSVMTGADGLSAKVFLLSAMEVFGHAKDASDSVNYVEGAILDWFRITPIEYTDNYVYINGSACDWWLRTPCYGRNYYVCNVDINDVGTICLYMEKASSIYGGVRLALILPSDALIDENFNVIA
jgi:hypothetical protein